MRQSLEAEMGREGTECILEREEKEKKSYVLTDRDVQIWLLPLELWLSLASLARQKRLCEAILSPAKVIDKIKFDVRVNASMVSDPRLYTAVWAIPNRNNIRLMACTSIGMSLNSQNVYQITSENEGATI